MTLWLSLGTAGILGFLHALEVDHMIAVTTFVATRPALGTALRFGARWGIGHSLAVLTAGGILLATGLRWPPEWDAVGEALVGVMLILVGVWAIRATRNLHLHRPAEHGNHAHLHVHHDGDERHEHRHATPNPSPSGNGPSVQPHRHATTLVGLLHGLAGTTGAIALIPVTLIESPWVGIGFLLAFSVGVVVAMTLYAFAAAVAIRRAGAHSLSLGRRVSQAIGGTGILIGVWWIVRAVAGM